MTENCDVSVHMYYRKLWDQPYLAAFPIQSLVFGRLTFFAINIARKKHLHKVSTI